MFVSLSEHFLFIHSSLKDLLFFVSGPMVNKTDTAPILKKLIVLQGKQTNKQITASEGQGW